MKASLCLRDLLALSAVAVMFHAGAAVAQTPAPGKKEIVAAVVPNYPPFEFKDPETDKLTGFDIDLGEALAAKMGVKMVWSETSFDQMMSALATNRVDIILSGMTDLPERRASVNFLDYIKSGPQFYALKTRAVDFPNMGALCGKKVGSSRRTSFPTNTAAWSDEHCVKAGKPPITVVGTDGSSDARMQLRQGRLDAAVQGGETLPYQNRIDQNAYVSIGAPFMAQYTGIGMAKNNTALNAAVTKAFEQLIADGTYQKILTKWGLQEQGVQKAIINASN
ncbi:Lysine-arginine-ornithine-binding periplasmic protein precursor (TC 3.A.1.3.1) [Caballeronia glathei]|jgi:polar amino acid transport system substrate-binding protein|uniref:ABC transporter substrate-binding protein n=1 Tax=Caballeronia glathei TaxID=60547 RepID=A0A069PR36_9BURK|nr:MULTISPECIES: ABC transporter substrate-binding protein [Burkholderiaceae]KDR42334.1 ABC transporter substrate-binding protein [Caballeronia glathei]TCK36156.1 amino acid ABC transporter substrate-binding protein (PAAT family) [Paraburkholderia sp. BL8N3]CDY79664.1 Lysine-arginine-ornithine-binding periplasmic protein precursor (TC 3.A.1.3.1) [Caballeronia glathei]